MLLPRNDGVVSWKGALFVNREYLPSDFLHSSWEAGSPGASGSAWVLQRSQGRILHTVLAVSEARGRREEMLTSSPGSPEVPGSVFLIQGGWGAVALSLTLKMTAALCKAAGRGLRRWTPLGALLRATEPQDLSSLFLTIRRSWLGCQDG